MINIGKHSITENSPCFIIAELSANHNQDYDLAVKTIKAMREAGADAVKFQTFSPDTLTINCKENYFKIGKDSLWKDLYLYDLYKSAMMPWEWQKSLKKLIEDLDMVCFSTPTDTTSVDFLEELDMPVYKIASFEITDIPLIEYIAQKNKPIIFSTGIATYEEIDDAINACEKYGNNKYILLKCTSAYPTPWKEVNLNVIPNLKSRYNCIVGLSDHTMGHVVPLGAVSLGARIVEKHFILDRSLGGPDASFSMEPHEFKEMVENIRILEKSMGMSKLELSEKAAENIVFARSLFIVENIKKGDMLNASNIKSIRPGYGIKPKYYNQVLGKIATKDIKRGTPLSFDLFK